MSNIILPFELNPDSPFSKGLVAWYPCGAPQSWGGRKLHDLSPYGNHGTLTNMDPATDWVHDGERAGLDYDGTNDYVTVPHNTSFDLNEFTLSQWVNIESTTNSIKVVSEKQVNSSDRNWWLSYRGDQAKQWQFKSSGSGSSSELNSNTAAEAGKWAHLVITADGTTVRMYRDNVLQTNTLSYTSMDTQTEPINIGYEEGSGRHFDGRIDDVRIYNRALSAAEVAALYHETLGGGYGSLVRPRRRVYSVPATGGGGGPVVPIIKTSLRRRLRKVF